MKLLKGKDYSNFDNIDFIGIINSFDILDNLVYFEFDLSTYDSKDPAKSEIINNFKSLKYLILNNSRFSSKFELKLNKLKYLKLKNCTNIIFNKSNFSELKY